LLVQLELVVLLRFFVLFLVVENRAVELLAGSMAITGVQFLNKIDE
jgi:hypothetical protein